jgi:pimeloyl-ACP methyl ester carboxylesterase
MKDAMFFPTVRHGLHGWHGFPAIREIREIRVFAAACLALTAIPPAHGACLETSVPPRAEDKFKSAAYRVWIPEGARVLRGVIVKQHGCGRHGLTHANDVQWQALAGKWDCALLGSWLQPASSNCADWYDPKNGSGQAFLTALKTFAAQSRHPELEQVPWALWGHSGGAHWAVLMANQHPERVAAVFAQSGGLAGTHSPALHVPMIFNRGANDFTNVLKAVDGSFTNNRPRGAFWAVAVNPKAKHECGHGRQLAIPFFDALLQQRLAKWFGRPELRPVNRDAAWLGDPATGEIAPPLLFPGEPARASWLPDERIARLWQEFVRTGGITDTTPPPPPTNLVVAVAAGAVNLTWDAEADLESGLKTFNVYRDGKLVGSFAGPTNNAAKGSFQIGNYGDEAEPATPQMTFTDTKAPAGRRRYEVTSVNWAGLESPRSAPARVRVP